MTTKAIFPKPGEIDELSVEILRIANVVEAFPTAAKLDAQPKVERLQTMESALRRDIDAVPGGAGASTVAALYSKLRQETTNLGLEVSVLDQGNPTTVSAIGDVAMDAIESAKEKLEDAINVIRDKVSNDTKQAH